MTLNLIFTLHNMCQYGLHVRGALVAHRYTVLMRFFAAEPSGATGLLFPCQYLCDPSQYLCDLGDPLFKDLGLAGFKRANAFLLS